MENDMESRVICGFHSDISQGMENGNYSVIQGSGFRGKKRGHIVGNGRETQNCDII